MIDRDFDKTNFILKVPADETNIDINTILDFFKNNSFSLESIREYAEKNLTWNVIIKKLISEM